MDRVRDFNDEYLFFINKIKNNEHFALTRWGDGELEIIKGNYINLLDKGNGEFLYDNKNESHDFYKNKLTEAYLYNDKFYFVGIACSCCVGIDNYEYMKVLSTQSENNLTWANIFVNSNYKYLDTTFIPSLVNKDVIMIHNSLGNTHSFPINLKKSFLVGKNAWIDDYQLIQDIITYINSNDIKNHVFIIAAGPLANIMVHNLWVNNKNNTYIDVGSIFDKHLGLKLTRGYQLGKNTINKKCIW